MTSGLLLSARGDIDQDRGLPRNPYQVGPVTAAERDELLGLLEAMGMPTDPIAELNVAG